MLVLVGKIVVRSDFRDFPQSMQEMRILVPIIPPVKHIEELIYK